MADITKIKVNGTTYNIKDASAVETVTVNNVTLMPVDNDINIGTVVTSESDPTVPSWAKASTKPTYTASEVGAQETLVSGTNIKTINNNSILGSGNLEVGGGGTVVYDGDSTTDTPYENLFMDTVASGVNGLIVGGIDMDLLWENSTPTEAFSAQTVSGISVSDYALIYILLKLGKTSPKFCTVLIESSNRNQFYATIIDGSARAYRMVTLSNTSVTFTNAFQGSFSASVTESGNYVIPYAIYGIKSATAISKATESYKSGDVLRISNYSIFCGHLTGSAKKIEFYIPFDKPCEATSATLTGVIYARHVGGGYLLNSVDFTSANVGTISYQVKKTGLWVQATSENAYTVANNTPVSVAFNNATITFGG